MTDDQRDDLMIELNLYSPIQIREFVREFKQVPKPANCDFPLYEYLKERLEIEGYWKKVGLA